MARHAKTDQGQRMRRTIAAVAVGLIGALVTLIGILPEVLNLIHSGMGDFMSPEVRAIVLGAAGFTAALSITVNKIMQLAKLRPLLDKLGLGESPEGDEVR